MSLSEVFRVKDTRLVPLVIILLAMGMVLGGLWTVMNSWYQPLADAWHSRQWVETPAILDDIALLAEDGTVILVPNEPGLPPEVKAAILPSGLVRLRVRYHFYEGEAVYSGHRYGLHKLFSDGDAIRLAAAKHYRKQEIQIWVNPDNPHESMMNRDLEWGGMLIGIPGLVFTMVGVTILGIALRTVWQQYRLEKKRQLHRRT